MHYLPAFRSATVETDSINKVALHYNIQLKPFSSYKVKKKVLKVKKKALGVQHNGLAHFFILFSSQLNISQVFVGFKFKKSSNRL